MGHNCTCSIRSVSKTERCIVEACVISCQACGARWRQQVAKIRGSKAAEITCHECGSKVIHIRLDNESENGENANYLCRLIAEVVQYDNQA
jgi:hypothetical protein